MKKRYLAAVAALALVPAVAFAHGGHDGERRGGKRMERVDTDKDGKVSADEARAASAERFKRIDVNGDGVITPDEAPAMFERPDANGDGKVTPDELAALAEARLLRADADGDRAVSKEERKAARDKWKERRGDHHKGERHKGGEGEKPAEATP